MLRKKPLVLMLGDLSPLEKLLLELHQISQHFRGKKTCSQTIGENVYPQTWSRLYVTVPIPSHL